MWLFQNSSCTHQHHIVPTHQPSSTHPTSTHHNIIIYHHDTSERRDISVSLLGRLTRARYDMELSRWTLCTFSDHAPDAGQYAWWDMARRKILDWVCWGEWRARDMTQRVNGSALYIFGRVAVCWAMRVMWHIMMARSAVFIPANIDRGGGI